MDRLGEALNILSDPEKNLFITGFGGSGKSYLLKQIYSHLQSQGKCVRLTASTGVAAVNIGGTTIHSWAGIGLGDKSEYELYINILKNLETKERWKSIEYLIIDEISMIGSKLLRKLEAIARLIRDKNKVFGGIQIIVSGDMCQLPPVNDKFCFEDKIWDTLNFEIIYLNTPWRFINNNDLTWFHMLQRIRIGKHTQEDIDLLKTRVKAYQDEKIITINGIIPTKLYSKNIDVYTINQQELEKIQEDAYEYVATDTINYKKDSSGNKYNISKSTYKSLMDKNIHSEILLKKGAQVMLTKNIDVNSNLCNGSRGVVLECKDNTVLVRFKDCEFEVQPESWIIEDDYAIFTRTQIPLILGYAFTIHKSQGVTLDHLIVSLGKDIFMGNLAYVALSRCRSLKGLFITSLSPDKIFPLKESVKFEEKIKEQQFFMVEDCFEDLIL